jgi:cytochrome c biogenesis protein CcdA
MSEGMKSALVYAHGAMTGFLLVAWMTAPGILATGILTGWNYRDFSPWGVIATIVGGVVTVAWAIVTRRWVFKQLERSLDWLLDRVRNR